MIAMFMAMALPMASSTPPSTRPVTLSCTMVDGGKATPITLRLDAAHGSVRYATPASGQPSTRRALFTQEQVMFDGFTLDRRTLALTQDGDSVTASLGAQPRAIRGRCRVVRNGK